MQWNRRQLLAGSAALGAGLMASPLMAQRQAAQSTAPVIDVHTHMFSDAWLQTARSTQDDSFTLGPDNELSYRGDSMGRVSSAMLDYAARIHAMDEAGVDIALISLTAPNVFWGTEAESVAAARGTNDEFADAAARYDGRIRWMANLPWQHSEAALEELRRCKERGAIGVCTLTTIAGEPLTAPRFRPLWREIEAMDLPVFIHPTKPGHEDPNIKPHAMINSIGFTGETSLCLATMIYEGFLDEFPRLNIIASHGGGTFPYLLGRFDIMWQELGVSQLEQPPSSYARRFHFDSIVFDQATLAFLIAQVGHDRVLYGSDYPFRIGSMSRHLGLVDQLPGAQRDAVRSGNLLKIFDL